MIMPAFMETIAEEKLRVCIFCIRQKFNFMEHWPNSLCLRLDSSWRFARFEKFQIILLFVLVSRNQHISLRVNLAYAFSLQPSAKWGWKPRTPDGIAHVTIPFTIHRNCFTFPILEKVGANHPIMHHGTLYSYTCGCMSLWCITFGFSADQHRLFCLLATPPKWQCALSDIINNEILL